MFSLIALRLYRKLSLLPRLQHPTVTLKLDALQGCFAQTIQDIITGVAVQNTVFHLFKNGFGYLLCFIVPVHIAILLLCIAFFREEIKENRLLSQASGLTGSFFST